jgi:hypothetical protein
LSDFKNRAASTSDFITTAETESGRSFTNFFSQWYNGEGFPTHSITYFKPNANTLLLLVSQTTSAPSITPLFTGKLELRITSASGDTTVIVDITQNNQIFEINNYPKTPNGIVIDPNNWVINNTGIVTNGVVVPVTLADFNIQRNSDCSFNINWITESESHISTYEIEQAIGNLPFRTIGTVNGKNRSRNEYQFVTEKVKAGNPKFRIKINITDGSFSYSGILSGETNCEFGNSIVVFPNPFKNELQFEYISSTSEKIEIRLLNEKGQLLHKSSKTIYPGGEKIILKNMEKIPSGSYYLNITKPSGETISNKVIKQG